MKLHHLHSSVFPSDMEAFGHLIVPLPSNKGYDRSILSQKKSVLKPMKPGEHFTPSACLLAGTVDCLESHVIQGQKPHQKGC